MGFLKKIDKAIYGVIIGAALPFVGFFLSYLIKRKFWVTLEDYAEMMLNSSSLDQTDILISCMIPNMLLFYFVNFRWNIYEFTKGLVAMTLLLGLSLFFFTL